ncbi:hypothetical protein J4448_07345 [Candidatus Woesearchaeota archaeon]|nr:hypothetical protein [Candidatus Woesearchaeota archaeon]
MAISELIQSLIITIITIPLNGLLLMLTTKIFKLADQSYRTAIKLTTILGIIGFLLGILSITIKSLSLVITIAQWLIISILLALWLIKSFYKLDWGKTLLVWLVWFILYIILAFLIGILVVSVIVGLLFAGKIPLNPNINV